VSRFCNALLYAMAERVDVIQRSGWERNDCSLDVDGLVREQKSREQQLAAALTRREETDWDKVRAQLQRLASRISGNAI
jgi:hypothetical protein